jgi:SNF2 family DNA or RNA helicase
VDALPGPLTLEGFLADEKGLGKTVQGLLFCYMASLLAYCHHSVATEPEKSGESECPMSKRLPFRCVCEPNCLAFLKKWHPLGAQLLVVPSTLLRNCVKDFRKMFDHQWRHPARLQLYYGHASLKPSAVHLREHAKNIRLADYGNIPDLATKHVILTTAYRSRDTSTTCLERQARCKLHLLERE